MDPIKVDFSSNNNDKGQGKSKVVMPPEKKALKIVININAKGAFRKIPYMSLGCHYLIT